MKRFAGKKYKNSKNQSEEKNIFFLLHSCIRSRQGGENENLRAFISEIENNMATGRCGMGENNGGHNEGGR